MASTPNAQLTKLALGIASAAVLAAVAGNLADGAPQPEPDLVPSVATEGPVLQGLGPPVYQSQTRTRTRDRDGRDHDDDDDDDHEEEDDDDDDDDRGRLILAAPTGSSPASAQARTRRS